MKDEIISFETAVLAKEKGFNTPTFLCYSDYDKITLPFKVGNELYKNNLEYYSAPTQSLLQRWLREVYNIHIEVKVQDYVEHPTYYWGIFGKHKNLSLITKLKDSNEIKYNTYEEALEEGLKQALLLL